MTDLGNRYKMELKRESPVGQNNDFLLGKAHPVSVLRQNEFLCMTLKIKVKKERIENEKQRTKTNRP